MKRQSTNSALSTPDGENLNRAGYRHQTHAGQRRRTEVVEVEEGQRKRTEVVELEELVVVEDWA